MLKGIMILTRTLGDIVLGNTLSKGIKAKYPDIELDWIVEARYKDVLEGNPDIKNIITVDEAVRDWDKVLKIATSDGYDKVLIPAQLSHTDSCWHHNKKFMGGHLVDFYARRCGITLPERRLYMYPDKSDFEIADKIIKDHIREGQKFIAMHTTTLVTAKDWQIEKFNEVAKWLMAKDIAIFQLGAESDRVMEGIIDLRDKLTFRQIAALLSKCSLFLGLDSGLSYIAAAMGIPVICIMGMSMPITSGPFGDNVTFIEPTSLPPECSWRCHSNCRFGQDRECIKTIGVDRVIEVVEKVLV